MQNRPQPNRTMVVAAAAAVVLIVLAALSYVYRARIKLGCAVLVDETGSKTAAAVCLVLGLFTLACLFLWLIFPVLLYLGLKDLRRRTSALVETTQACAQHLSQLSRDQNALEKKIRDHASAVPDRDSSGS